MRCTARKHTPTTSSWPAVPTTSSRSRATSPRCATSSKSCPGQTSRSGTPAPTGATGEWKSAPSKVVAVSAGIVFPHAVQAIQITRKTRKLNGKKWRTEVVYAVTSLTAAQATDAELATWLRGHWRIENRLHWVRDVTFDEDRSQIRTGNGPRIMASLRNLAISIMRLASASNIAQALRHHAWDPLRPVALLLTS